MLASTEFNGSKENLFKKHMQSNEGALFLSMNEMSSLHPNRWTIMLFEKCIFQ